MIRYWHLAVLCLVFALATPANAQTYTVTSATGGSIGNVAASGVSPTTFRIAPSTGAVTTVAGSYVRISTGTAGVTVTISCGNQAACATDLPKVSISSSGTPSGRAAALATFTASSGTATVSGASGTNPLTFTLTSIGQNLSKTFRLGFDLPINTSGTTGPASSAFTVTVTRNNGTGAVTGSGSGTASVFRGIAITKSTDLSFGKIVRPSAGSGTVTLTAAGARSVTGTNTAALASPAATVAAFSVTGEGGQAVTVTVPASFTMTSGANSLTVTTASTGSGVQNLSSTITNAGSLAVSVGGSFPLTSATATGAYTGTFTVSVAYN